MRGREITPHFLSEPEAIVYIGETQPPIRRQCAADASTMLKFVRCPTIVVMRVSVMDGDLNSYGSA
jgi:hypothetical protein